MHSLIFLEWNKASYSTHVILLCGYILYKPPEGWVRREGLASPEVLMVACGFHPSQTEVYGLLAYAAGLPACLSGRQVR